MGVPQELITVTQGGGTAFRPCSLPASQCDAIIDRWLSHDGESVVLVLTARRG